MKQRLAAQSPSRFLIKAIATNDEIFMNYEMAKATNHPAAESFATARSRLKIDQSALMKPQKSLRPSRREGSRHRWL